MRFVFPVFSIWVDNSRDLDKMLTLHAVGERQTRHVSSLIFAHSQWATILRTPSKSGKPADPRLGMWNWNMGN